MTADGEMRERAHTTIMNTRPLPSLDLGLDEYPPRGGNQKAPSTVECHRCFAQYLDGLNTAETRREKHTRLAAAAQTGHGRSLYELVTEKPEFAHLKNVLAPNSNDPAKKRAAFNKAIRHFHTTPAHGSNMEDDDIMYDSAHDDGMNHGDQGQYAYDNGHGQYHGGFSGGGGGGGGQYPNGPPQAYGGGSEGGGSTGGYPPPPNQRPPRSGNGGFSGGYASSDGRHHPNGSGHGHGGQYSSGGSRPAFPFSAPAQGGHRRAHSLNSGLNGFETPTMGRNLNNEHEFAGGAPASNHSNLSNHTIRSNHSHGSRVSTPRKRRGGGTGRSGPGSMNPPKSPRRGEGGAAHRGVDIPRMDQDQRYDNLFRRVAAKNRPLTRKDAKLWIGDDDCKYVVDKVRHLIGLGDFELYQKLSGGNSPYELGHVISDLILKVSHLDGSVNRSLDSMVNSANCAKALYPTLLPLVERAAGEIQFAALVLDENIKADADLMSKAGKNKLQLELLKIMVGAMDPLLKAETRVEDRVKTSLVEHLEPQALETLRENLGDRGDHAYTHLFCQAFQIVSTANPLGEENPLSSIPDVLQLVDVSGEKIESASLHLDETIGDFAGQIEKIKEHANLLKVLKEDVNLLVKNMKVVKLWVSRLDAQANAILAINEPNEKDTLERVRNLRDPVWRRHTLALNNFDPSSLDENVTEAFDYKLAASQDTKSLGSLLGRFDDMKIAGDDGSTKPPAVPTAVSAPPPSGDGTASAFTIGSCDLGKDMEDVLHEHIQASSGDGVASTISAKTLPQGEFYVDTRKPAATVELSASVSQPAASAPASKATSATPTSTTAAPPLFGAAAAPTADPGSCLFAEEQPPAGATTADIQSAKEGKSLYFSDYVIESDVKRGDSLLYVDTSGEMVPVTIKTVHNSDPANGPFFSIHLDGREKRVLPNTLKRRDAAVLCDVSPNEVKEADSLVYVEEGKDDMDGVDVTVKALPAAPFGKHFTINLPGIEKQTQSDRLRRSAQAVVAFEVRRIAAHPGLLADFATMAHDSELAASQSTLTREMLNKALELPGFVEGYLTQHQVIQAYLDLPEFAPGIALAVSTAGISPVAGIPVEQEIAATILPAIIKEKLRREANVSEAQASLEPGEDVVGAVDFITNKGRDKWYEFAKMAHNPDSVGEHPFTREKVTIALAKPGFVKHYCSNTQVLQWYCEPASASLLGPL